MKYLAILCLLYPANLRAQQAKAYEMVNYNAKSGKFTYVLNYADGYLLASRIKIRQGKMPATVLQPGIGATSNNGNLIFNPLNNAAGKQVILQHISETAAAPFGIRAICVFDKRQINLYFKRVKKQQ